MTIIAADGQNVRPVEVDEFQIGTAEIYDVIITPGSDEAYAVVAESMDRSGMALAMLASRPGARATVPALRDPPLLTMGDMGMDHGSGGMDHGAMSKVAPADAAATGGTAGAAMGATDHAAMGHGQAAGPAESADGGMAGMAMGGMSMDGMKMRDTTLLPPDVAISPGVDMVSMAPVDKMGDPGIGLRDVPHRVLNYRMLTALEPNRDTREPSRLLELHLTGNMERYMWSFDGVKMSDKREPIPFLENERVRVTLVNDTMMSHPIHLHGHFFELVTGHGEYSPRKHTVNVAPGGKVSFDVTANAIGDWAFHCHMLYHMHAGMMRVVSVRPRGDAA